MTWPSPGVFVSPAWVSFTRERTRFMIVRKDVSPLVLRLELIVGLDMDTPINTNSSLRCSRRLLRNFIPTSEAPLTRWDSEPIFGGFLWSVRSTTEFCVGILSVTHDFVLLFCWNGRRCIALRSCGCFGYARCPLLVSSSLIGFCSIPSASTHSPFPVTDADSTIFHTVKCHSCLGLLAA